MLRGEARSIKGACSMKVIILSGEPKTGKSTTLNDVFDNIASRINPPPTKTPLDPPDFEAIFPYKRKVVAIYSEGDLLYLIKDAIHKYATQCDVLILAYSDRFKRDYKPALFDLARELAGDVQECVIRKMEANDTDNAIACKNIINNIAES
jgi:hypothetical protein